VRRSASILAAALVVLLAPATRAAVTARVQINPPRVAVGDAADLTVDVQGTQNTATPVVPTVDGLTVQYVGPSTQLSIVNGKTSSSITHHYSVTARRDGTFTIGPITVDADGQTIQAGTATLQVASGGAAGSSGGDQLRLDLTAPRTTVYLHERLPVTVTLRVGSVQVGDVQYPQIPGDGFALEQLGKPEQRQEVRDGGVFQVVEFQGGLTPLRAGSVTVGPATMSMSMVTARSAQRHAFFFGGPTRQAVELTSQPLVLDVLPLPDPGKPADFSGAVGHFSLDVRGTPLEVTAGDPVTMTYTLHGEGDLSSATPPAIAGSDTLRVYPVQPATTPPGSPAGTRAFEQVVIPQQAGSVRLPQVRFNWFDPEARAYRVAQHAPIVVTVKAAPQGAGPQIVGATGKNAERPAESLGRDIVFIKDAPGALAPIGAHWWRSPLFWTLQLIPLLLLLGATLVDRRRERLGADLRYARFTRAGRAARAALGEAREALSRGDAVGFHDRVAHAVSEYLAAKLDLPPGAVTADAASARLREVGLVGGVADELREFLAACEVARFAPSAAGDGDMRRTLGRAERIIRSLERTRRLGRLATAACALLMLLAAGAGRAAETPQAIFFRANALYAEGKYAQAAAEYERLLATGVGSASTYFNLGNAYLKAGQTGRAVLAYERARRLAPGDPDLRANLTFAREAGATAEPPPWRTRLLFPLAASWSSDALVLGAACAWWLLMGLLAAGRLLPTARRATARAALLPGVALVVLGGSAAWRLATVDLRPTAVVVAPNEVAVRFEPSSGGTVHFQAKPGTTLRLVGEREGWAQVERDDGRRGWIERDAIDRV
jgi:tetratricopeptide (TPR) repeat protein